MGAFFNKATWASRFSNFSPQPHYYTMIVLRLGDVTQNYVHYLSEQHTNLIAGRDGDVVLLQTTGSRALGSDHRQ